MQPRRIGPQMMAAAILASAAVWMAGCQQAPPPDTRAADEAAIREADVAWAKIAATKDIENFVAYYADDAVLMLPNIPIASGKDAIRAGVKPLFEMPGFSLTFGPEKIEAARSGDMAYVRGAYKITMNDPKGQPFEDRGKYIELWKKQPDGKWKCAADMVNSDLPLPAPPK